MSENKIEQVAAEKVFNGKAPPPDDLLPDWGLCQLKVENEEYRLKNGYEQEITVEADKTPTMLERFLHEYEDVDPLRNAWFRGRLQLVVIEARESQARRIAELEREKGEWIAANGPGGWIDDLRKRAPEPRASRTGISTPLIGKLNNIAVWLENGCSPSDAAKELRLVSAWIEGASPDGFSIESRTTSTKPTHEREPPHCPTCECGEAKVAAEPEGEPNWKHPKLQALISEKVRLRIELSMIDALIEDPKIDLSFWQDYETGREEKLRAALTKGAVQ